MSFLEPAVGFLYVGQLSRALVFLLLTLGFHGGMYVLFSSWERPTAFVLSLGGMLLLYFFFKVYAAILAFRRAKQLNQAKIYPRTWFANFLFVIGVYLLFSYLSEQFVVELQKMGQQYSLSDQAMEPRLLKGDVVYLDKRSRSLQDLQGKVVLYNASEFGKKQAYLGRVVAQAGQRVKFAGGRLMVDGKVLNLQYQQNLNLEESHFYAASGWEFKQDFIEGRELTIPAGTHFIIPEQYPQHAGSHFWGPLASKDVLGVARFISVSIDPEGGKVRLPRSGLEIGITYR